MNSAEEEIDEDQLFRELEEDDDHLMDAMRENRMQQIKKEIALQKQKSMGYGSLQVFKDEKQLMLMTTSTEKCVIHFSHKDFKKCATMDKHLDKLARLHPQTRFVKVDVENVPFLVDRMEIKVLPCIISFVNGIGVDRLLGFDGITEGEDFPTWMLEKRLSQSKVLKLPEIQKIIQFAEPDSDDD